MPAGDLRGLVGVAVGEHDVVGHHALVLGEAAEGDRRLVGQVVLHRGLGDLDVAREQRAIQPVEREHVDGRGQALELGGAHGAAVEALEVRELVEGGARDADLVDLGGAGHAGDEVDGVAGDDLAVGEDLAPVQAAAQEHAVRTLEVVNIIKIFAAETGFAIMLRLNGRG